MFVTKNGKRFFFLFSNLLFINVIPEQSKVKYYNKRFMSSVDIAVRRMDRKSPYSINIEGQNLQPWHNNVTLNLIFLQLLTNEYKKSFVELHFKFCDLINNDSSYIGSALAKKGVVCPLLPKYHKIENLTFSTKGFRFKWPFERARVVLQLRATSPEAALLVDGYIDIRFQDDRIVKKKP